MDRSVRDRPAFSLIGAAVPSHSKAATDENPYPMRALAEELRAIGDQGYALAEKALKVAEDEGTQALAPPGNRDRLQTTPRQR